MRQITAVEEGIDGCAGYPYMGIYFFVPCAVLAALGIWVPFTASVMTLDMLWNSSELIWNQM